ncbi:Uncharacterized protein HZ326_25831 [Fusarium oxysporum f. sp. albedinis]|nr:Uncharacterized protein HZ326_25831 [Fusarium oxysporum f. sp. albedinis]
MESWKAFSIFISQATSTVSQPFGSAGLSLTVLSLFSTRLNLTVKNEPGTLLLSCQNGMTTMHSKPVLRTGTRPPVDRHRIRNARATLHVQWDAISLNTGRVPSFTPSLFKPATTYISAFTRLIRI